MDYLNTKQKIIILLFIISYIAFFVISLLLIVHDKSTNESNGQVQGATSSTVRELIIDSHSVIDWSESIKITANSAHIIESKEGNIEILKGEVLLDVTAPNEVIFGNVNVSLLQSGRYSFDYDTLTLKALEGHARAFEEQYVTSGQSIDLRIYPGVIE
jgi:hypothetical protein